MRRVSEHYHDAGEFVEGVKVREEDGFVLVLPDQDRPIIHVYASYTTADREQARLVEVEKELRAWEE
jgi:mannose-1-phosphate guanylyltransferase/phosphomannomutase